MRLLPAGAPRLGLGLAALGRPGYITLNRGADLADRSVEAMRTRAEEVLDAAYAASSTSSARARIASTLRSAMSAPRFSVM